MKYCYIGPHPKPFQSALTPGFIDLATRAEAEEYMYKELPRGSHPPYDWKAKNMIYDCKTCGTEFVQPTKCPYISFKEYKVNPEYAKEYFEEYENK